MINPEKIIYSINIEDVQNVAEQEFERKLTAKELRLVEKNVGDYINWYEAILNAIDVLKIKP
ncbi:MAG: hypothetical protein A3G70_00265 [Planctomycetes bacterium RIFCSPLOWO2_12_FULL_39_13]|nr:MAG: hypothetical protein A3G70_00265 [Planctomycetes bacterium RIFCSPLOWO2_12_FULL_39_13]